MVASAMRRNPERVMATRSARSTRRGRRRRPPSSARATEPAWPRGRRRPRPRSAPHPTSSKRSIVSGWRVRPSRSGSDNGVSGEAGAIQTLIYHLPCRSGNAPVGLWLSEVYFAAVGKTLLEMNTRARGVHILDTSTNESCRMAKTPLAPRRLIACDPGSSVRSCLLCSFPHLC